MIEAHSTVKILEMIEKLRKNGNWAGETHVQKAMFFLDKKCQVDTGFEFVLYKHGPYSFELHDTLDFLFALCLVEHEIRPPYGPRIKLTKNGKMFLARHDDELAPTKKHIADVASWFGSSGVGELEKLATALWVQSEANGQDFAEMAREVHKIKPHIPFSEAEQAFHKVNAFPA
ncbi:hypothetical protein [Desulfonatronum thiodismutans]|uniref:hypothetical protein n=1 Tax=Desulfonatronum thiodismutans TaxID=159290 RepID=UPI0004ABDE85|nr:hypothetical protein [Desulfonatronum thiodismutans]